jgi:hypothetical protein
VTAQSYQVLWTVTPEAGPNGTISPSTAQTVQGEGSVTFTATPSPHYQVGNWYVDWNDGDRDEEPAQVGGTTFTLTNVEDDATVTVTFVPIEWTVTPTAGDNGSVSPSTATSVQDGSSLTLTASPNDGYQVATWTVDGNTAQTGGDTFTLRYVKASHAVNVTFLESLAGVSLSASPVSPAVVGTVVTLTATPTGGADPEYQFAVNQLEGQNAGWSVVQVYGASNTCAWTPAAAGPYLLQVAVREAGSDVPYQYYDQLSYTVDAPLTAVSLAPTPGSPAPPNTAVTLTATPTGGLSPQYQFAVGNNGTWTIVQAYSAANVATWTPTTIGTYILQVTAVDSENAASGLVYTQVGYTVSSTLSGVGLAVSPSGSVSTNTQLELTATPTGGVNPEYQFSYGFNGTWTVIQAYGATSAINWTPTMAGSYVLQVEVREHGSDVAYQYYAQRDLVVSNKLSGVSLAASPGSPVLPGTDVTLTATAAGGVNPLFQFAVDQLNGQGWSILQANSSANVLSWTPTAPGSYVLQVTVTEKNSTNPYDYYAQMPFTVLPALSAVQLSASPSSPVLTKTAVALSATPTGGLNPEYQFAVEQGGTWSVLQAYSAASTATWTPTSAGAYILQVTVREHGSTVPYQVYKQLAFTVDNPLTAISLGTNPGSPALTGTTVTLTGAATGGLNTQYQFAVGQNGSWTVLQAYGSANTALWAPTVAGSYVLQVTAVDAGNSATPLVYAQQNFTVVSPLSAIMLTTTPTSPSPVGTAVTLKATVAGGLNPQYQFAVSPAIGTANWTILQAYGASPTAVWKSSAAGSYLLQVTAREQGSSVPYQVYAQTVYVSGGAVSPTARDKQ